MSFAVMLQQLSGGMVQCDRYLSLDTDHFSAVRSAGLQMQNVKNKNRAGDCASLHCDSEGNTSDAAAAGVVFWCFLSVWD